MTNDPSGAGAPPPPPPPQQPPPPPQQGWQSTPQPPASPPPAGGQPAGAPQWTSNITARGTISGPGGVALADVPERIIAYIIDAIIIGVIGFVISAILGGVLVETRTENVLGIPFTIRGPSLIGQVIALLLTLGVSAGYFIYMWTKMAGATVGMRLMKLSVRDAGSGGPITQGQAINRWLFLAGPQVLGYLTWVNSLLGLIAAVAVLGYYIYLLVTTAQSPTRQGLHDTRANTVVAKG